MYFDACAQLADARPELRGTIEAVDGLLEKNQGRPITLDFLIDVLDSPRREIEFIFESLQEADAFQSGVADFCSEHNQLLDETGQCDLCDDDQPAKAVSKPVLHVPAPETSLDPQRPHPKPTRVLISYSHDSPQHAARVLELSDQLREHGVDSHIDQYTPVPTEGWPLWMQRQIERADYVICVCSEEYQARFAEEVEQDVGRGVAWEANLIRNELYQAKLSNSGKFLTVQFDDYVPERIPAPMQGLTSFTLHEFRLDDPGYQKLYRHLTDQPATPITQLGELVRIDGRVRRSEGAPEKIDIREALSNPLVMPITNEAVVASEFSDPVDQRKELCAAWCAKQFQAEWQLLEVAGTSAEENVQKVLNLAKSKISEFCDQNREIVRDGDTTQDEAEKSESTTRSATETGVGDNLNGKLPTAQISSTVPDEQIKGYKERRSKVRSDENGYSLDAKLNSEDEVKTPCGASNEVTSKENKKKVFVSYSREDKSFVQRLVDDLKRQKLEVWFDEVEMKPGNSIPTELSRGLQSAEYVIVVLSSNSIHSKWVEMELNSALMAENAGEETVVIPVKLGECDVPALIRHKVYADFTSDYDAAFGDLISVFRGESLQKSQATNAVPNLNCQAQLSQMRPADLRRLLCKLGRPGLGLLWFDVLNTNMEDDHANRTLGTCAMELLMACERQGILADLFNEICETPERRRVLNPT